MSDIIDSVCWLSFTLDPITLPRDVIVDVYEKHENELPANCFLHELYDDVQDVSEDDVICEAHGCGTVNDGDAKYCKECGRRLTTNSSDIELTSLDWSDEDSAESWHRIFVKRIVPYIKGTVEACVAYGDPDDTSTPWKNFYFRIHDGHISYCTMHLSEDADAPVFDTEQDVSDEDDERP